MRPDYPEEVSRFLRRAMIQEGGIYTLLGSKPMTIFLAEKTQIPEGQEEKEEIYQHSLAHYQSQKKAGKIRRSMPAFPSSYEEYFSELEETKRLEDQPWKYWEVNGIKYVGKQYCFAWRQKFGIMQGIFMNLPLCAYELHANYDDFKTLTQLEFDPCLILNEIHQEGSLFWDRVFSNHYLLGILLGFGNKNAQIYEWEELEKTSSDGVIYQLPDDKYFELFRKEVPEISDLLLPWFGFYSIHDQVMSKYEEERKAILKMYEGKDFVDLTVKLLSQTQEVLSYHHR